MADMVMPTEGRIFCLNQSKEGLSASTHQFKAWLYKDALTPTPATTAGSMSAQQCDFAGYAPQGITWSSAVDNGAGDAHTFSPLVTFTRSTAGTAQLVGGLAVVAYDSGGTTPQALLLYADFATPVSMAAAGQTISRLIEWLQGQYPIT